MEKLLDGLKAARTKSRILPSPFWRFARPRGKEQWEEYYSAREEWESDDSELEIDPHSRDIARHPLYAEKILC